LELSTSTIEHERFWVVLWLHTDVDPPPSEWDATVARLVGLRQTRRLAVERIRQLVISDGGAPNAFQRNRLIRDLHEGLPCKSAVVTTALSNPIKRGIATALSWVNPAIRFYEPPRFREALEYLDLANEIDAIRQEYQNLQKRLRPVRALKSISVGQL
jgi:hypothetical protein